MSITTTKGRDSYISTLPETSIYQVIDLLSQPTPVDVSDTLVYLWADSTEEHAENGYVQQARILAAILDREVNRYDVANAMEACANISHLERGGDVSLISDGFANTEENRAGWLATWSENLAVYAHAIGGIR